MSVIASNCEELLKLAGSRQVKYVKHIDNKPVYRNQHNPNGQLILYTGR